MRQIGIFDGEVDRGRAITNYLDLKHKYAGRKINIVQMDDLYRQLHGMNKRVDLKNKQIRIQFDFNYENIQATLIMEEGKLRLDNFYDLYTDKNEFYDCIKVDYMDMIAIR